jgi:hypothetical protein
MHFSRSFFTVAAAAFVAEMAAASALPFVDVSGQIAKVMKRVVSPDETCGMVIGAGQVGKGYTCGSTNVGPCCSQYVSISSFSLFYDVGLGVNPTDLCMGLIADYYVLRNRVIAVPLLIIVVLDVNLLTA